MTTVAQTATLVYGYTMADVERLSREAAGRISFGRFTYSDKFEHAWFGVVEHLYATTEAPTRDELVRAGMRTISRAMQDEQRHQGTRGSGAHFAAYWDAAGSAPELRPGTLRAPRGADTFVDHLVEHIALPKVLGILSDLEYQALATLAVHPDRASAAAAIGISLSQYKRRLRAARTHFIEAWLDPETPLHIGTQGANAKQKAAGLCRRGHPQQEFSFRTSEGHLRCRKCLQLVERTGARRRRQQVRAEAFTPLAEGA